MHVSLHTKYPVEPKPTCEAHVAPLSNCASQTSPGSNLPLPHLGCSLQRDVSKLIQLLLQAKSPVAPSPKMLAHVWPLRLFGSQTSGAVIEPSPHDSGFEHPDVSQCLQPSPHLTAPLLPLPTSDSHDGATESLELSQTSPASSLPLPHIVGAEQPERFKYVQSLPHNTVPLLPLPTADSHVAPLTLFKSQTSLLSSLPLPHVVEPEQSAVSNPVHVLLHLSTPVEPKPTCVAHVWSLSFKPSQTSLPLIMPSPHFDAAVQPDIS